MTVCKFNLIWCTMNLFDKFILKKMINHLNLFVFSFRINIYIYLNKWNKFIRGIIKIFIINKNFSYMYDIIAR